MNKTKIVCTIGPNSCDQKTLIELIEAGMNVARLNGSHNTLDWHREIINRIRNINPNIPILLDLPGRKIRTIVDMEPIHFKKGDIITIASTSENKKDGKAPINYSNLYQDVKPGDFILADDGTLKFQVESISGIDILCKVMSDGVLKGGKGLNVPYIRVNTPLVTNADIEIMKFAVEMGVDWVGVSFVESGEHVKKIAEHLVNSSVGIISKIENQFGLENVDEILGESSGIMIDRGDLGAETSIENIGILQKKIIRSANIYGKPVIIATEMMHTMIEKSQPTKAEVMDVSNSILDGASAIMLSGETAVGHDPVGVVKTMRSIANEVENHYSNYFVPENGMKYKTIPNAIGKSIFEVCSEMPITKIICITQSGFAANMISRYRVNQDVIAVTDTIEKARKFNLLWGVTGISINIKFGTNDTTQIFKSAKKLFDMKLINLEDLVIFTAVLVPYKHNKMNFMYIQKISELSEVFNWEIN